METTLYKLNIDGIVYLVDPITSKAYTYDTTDLTEIGRVLWTDPKQPPKIALLEDWAAILAAKLDKKAAAAAATA
jgi:hypothetical protein